MGDKYNPIPLYFFNRAVERLECFRTLDLANPKVRELFEEDTDLLAAISKTRSADLEDPNKSLLLQSEDGKETKKVTIDELYFIVGVKFTQETLDMRKDPEKIKELGAFIDALYIESCDLFHEGLHEFYPDQFQPPIEEEEEGEEIEGEMEPSEEEVKAEATSGEPKSEEPKSSEPSSSV